MDVRVALQRRFQLFGKLQRLGAGAGGKCAHEARQAGLRNLRGKVDAGDARRGKHPRKIFLGLRRFQSRPIQQQLIARDRQQHACFIVRAGAERRAQFRPRRFILLRRARMSEIIHSRELEQDVQAAYERARSSRACGLVHQDRVGLKPRLYL